MNKRFSAIVLSAFLALGAVSCGSDPADNGGDGGGVTTPWGGLTGSPEQHSGTVPVVGGSAKYVGSAALPEGVDGSKFWDLGTPIIRAYDGSGTTIYQSPWAGKDLFPVELTFTLDAAKAASMDGLTLFTRTIGSTGVIQDVDIFVKSEGGDFVKVAERRGASGAIDVQLPTPIAKPREIKLVVSKGVDGLVSLSEIVCSQFEGGSYDCFADLTCSALKSGVEMSQIEQIGDTYLRNLAKGLWYGQRNQTPPAGEDPAVTAYNPAAEGRVVEVQTCQYPEVMAAKNGTSPYGRLDNPTGFVAKSGQYVVVFIDDLPVGADVSAILFNPARGAGTNYELDFQKTTLRRGANSFKASGDGTIYILCQTLGDDWQNKKTKVHITSGTRNGVYVLGKNQPSQWSEMLGKTKLPFFEMVGKYVTLVMPVSELKARIPDPDDYIKAWDNLVLEEQRFAGHEKYNRMNNTRQNVVGGVNLGYMFAWASGGRSYVGLSPGTLPVLMPASKLHNNIWGSVHELGHVNQMRPAMKWGAQTTYGDMSEVSNNIFSLYMQTKIFGQESRVYTEKTYDKAYMRSFVSKRPHATDDDKVYGSFVFERLIPFWQLQLYFAEVKGNADFYADLMERLRNDTYYTTLPQPNSDENVALQVRGCMDRFALNVSQHVKLDMVTFFNDWGFELSPATVAEIHGLGFPAPTQELRYVNDGNVGLFKTNGAVVVGTAAVTTSGYQIYVRINNGSGATAYEVYDGDKLVGVSMSTTFSFNSSAAPAGLTVKAVAANGTRTVVPHA